MSKRRLGKGIDALLGDVAGEEAARVSVSDVGLDLIDSDPSQPRKHFSEEALDELAESIQSRGVIQPVILEAAPHGRYRIVAGERRLRAAKRAGLETVPAIVRSFSDDEKYEIALIENIQREDLNPIEEARGYQTIMDRYELTQDEIAHRLGKKRSTIANSLRLLRLAEDMQTAIVEARISAGHARALLSVSDDDRRRLLFEYVMEEEVSVREAERAAAALNQTGRIRGSEEGADRPRQAAAGSGDKTKRRQSESRKTPELQVAEERLIELLGTKVVISGTENRGRIEVSYYSLDDLNRLLDLLGAD